jgi:DUF4097 and DUF4098 domain-containing protein YvlB
MRYTVDVELEAGTVKVIAEERDAPTATVEPADGSNASREGAANTRVELRGDTFYVHAPKSRWLPGRSLKLDIEIRTPLGSAVKAVTASAEVDCRGELSNVTAKTASGDVAVERATGEVALQTASGDVQARRVDGDLRVDTASGDVTSDRVGGATRVHTASGDVTIGQATSDAVVATASGDVTLGTPGRGGVEAKTASGDVTLRVPTGTGVWLDLSTVSGTTRSDLDISAEAPGGGGPDLTLRVRTLSGDIEVYRTAQAATTA